MYKSARILSLIAALFIFAGCQSGDANNPDARSSDSEASTQPSTDSPTAHNILFFGDSIAAGYGLEPAQAFPALIQEKIKQAGWRFNVVNAGLSGDTSAGGLRRIDWLLREPLDVFILELGGNDGLRGTSPEVTKQNLQAIINRVRLKNPEAHIILAGMQIPPNLGQSHTKRFQEIFPELARENELTLIPFILKDVGGIANLNQADGIHPTAAGHEIIAETVWDTLAPILSDIAARDESCLATEEECEVDLTRF